MATKRRGRSGTWKGSSEKLAEVLEPYVPTKQFLIYSEDMDDGRQDVKTIKKHKDMLVALRTLSPNLSFSRETVEDALNEIAKDSTTLKNVPDNWAHGMSKRVKTICRHTSQILSRTQVPTWATELFGATADDKQGAGEEDFLIGFDWDSQQATKTFYKAGKVWKKAFSKEFQVAGLGPNDPVRVVFDGEVHDLVDFLKKDHDEMVQRNCKGKQIYKASLPDGKFITVNTSSQARPKLGLPADPICQIKIAGSQKLQVNYSWFKENSDAEKFAIEMAKAYVNGETSIATFKDFRNSSMQLPQWKDLVVHDKIQKKPAAKSAKKNDLSRRLEG